MADLINECAGSFSTRHMVSMSCSNAKCSYLAVTALLATPPALLRTVMFCGFDGQLICKLYLPLPLFVSVPIR